MSQRNRLTKELGLGASVGGFHWIDSLIERSIKGLIQEAVAVVAEEMEDEARAGGADDGTQGECFVDVRQSPTAGPFITSMQQPDGASYVVEQMGVVSCEEGRKLGVAAVESS